MLEKNYSNCSLFIFFGGGGTLAPTSINVRRASLFRIKLRPCELSSEELRAIWKRGNQKGAFVSLKIGDFSQRVPTITKLVITFIIDLLITDL